MAAHRRYHPLAPLRGGVSTGGWLSLLDPALEVIRTPAAPTRPVRMVGDIGIRALPWHLTALRRLWRVRRIDFLHITVPSFYSATLGELLYRR